MTKRTHVICGNALALAIMRPTSIKFVAIGMLATSIGSVICDLDITTSKSHKEMDKIFLLVLVGILGCVFFDNKYNLGIYNLLINNTNLFRIIIGSFLFLLVCFYGMHKPHRSFLHSILGLFILTYLSNIIFKDCSMYFFIGMLSHIFLDLFNKKSVQLLYPFDDRFCFKFCDSDGLINNLLCFGCSFVIIIEMIFFL